MRQMCILHLSISIALLRSVPDYSNVSVYTLQPTASAQNPYGNPPIERHRLYQCATKHQVCRNIDGWDSYGYGVIFSDEAIEGINSVRAEEGCIERESLISRRVAMKIEG